MTLEQATQYLSERQKELNISELAKYINLDTSALIKALKGERKIPKRCLQKLEQYFEWMRVIL